MTNRVLIAPSEEKLIELLKDVAIKRSYYYQIECQRVLYETVVLKTDKGKNINLVFRTLKNY